MGPNVNAPSSGMKTSRNPSSSLGTKGMVPKAVFKKVCSYAALLLISAFMMAPFVWMVLVSLHKPQSPIPTLSHLVPPRPHLSNYPKVLLNPNLPVSRFFFNSVFVSAAVVFGQLFVSSLAAYALSRHRFKGRSTVFFLFIVTMMFGSTVTQIPVYLMLQNLHWLNTYFALIVPGLSSAFTIFLLRQAFLSIPFELDEAAKLDGAGEMKIFWQVVIPLSRAALATAATFTFIGSWTDFFGPLLYTNSTRMRTLEVGLSIYHSAYGGNNWPLEMAASVIVMMPLLLVFLFGQKFFTKGISLGAIK